MQSFHDSVLAEFAGRVFISTACKRDLIHLSRSTLSKTGPYHYIFRDSPLGTVHRDSPYGLSRDTPWNVGYLPPPFCNTIKLIRQERYKQLMTTSQPTNTEDTQHVRLSSYATNTVALAAITNVNTLDARRSLQSGKRHPSNLKLT